MSVRPRGMHVSARSPALLGLYPQTHSPNSPNSPLPHLPRHQLSLLLVLGCSLVRPANLGHEVVDGAAEEPAQGSGIGGGNGTGQGTAWSSGGAQQRWGARLPWSRHPCHPQLPLTWPRRSPPSACPTPGSWPGGRRRSQRSGRSGPGRGQRGLGHLGGCPRASTRPHLSTVRPALLAPGRGHVARLSPATLTSCRCLIPHIPPKAPKVPKGAHLDVGVPVLLLL